MELARFDMKLPLSQRRELAAFAGEVGLSSADVARLAIRYMLEHRQLFLRPVEATRAQQLEQRPTAA
jgi:hypothetical protein